MNTSLTLFKPTATIQITNAFSLTETKLINLMICDSQRGNKFIRNNEEVVPRQVIPRKDVYEALSWTSKNDEPIKLAVTKLLTTAIVWNEFEEDRSTAWNACTFLSFGRLSGSNLTYILNPIIIEQIERPKLFAKLALVMQKNIKSTYSLNLWEMLHDIICRKKTTSSKYDDTFLIENVEIKYLIRMLGLHNSRYTNQKNYRLFTSQVLKPSIQEINDKTDLNVEIKTWLVDRKIVGYDFVVKPQPQQLTMNLSEPVSQLSIADHTNDEGDTIEQLTGFGITDRAARRIVSKYAANQISANLNYLQTKLDQGKKIKSTERYLAAAIRDNYAGNRESSQASHPVDTASPGKRPLPVQQTSNLDENKFQEHRHQRVREIFQSLSKAEQSRLWNDFCRRAERGDYKVMLGQHWNRKSQQKQHIARNLFYADITTGLLTDPVDTDITVFSHQ